MKLKHKKHEDNEQTHIIIKLFKTRDKKRILKAVREKKIHMYKGTKISMTSGFLSKKKNTSDKSLEQYLWNIEGGYLLNMKQNETL